MGGEAYDTLASHREYLHKCHRPSDLLQFRLLSAKWSVTIDVTAATHPGQVISVLSYESSLSDSDACTVAQWVAILDAMFHVDPKSKLALLAIDGQLVRTLTTMTSNFEKVHVPIGPQDFDRALADSDLPLSSDPSIVLSALELKFGCSRSLLRLVLLERWYDYEALFARLPPHFAGVLTSDDVLQHLNPISKDPLVYVRRQADLTFDRLVSSLQSKFDARRRR